jgi:hypothetical protein
MLALFGSKNEDFSIISNEDIYNDDVGLSVETAAAELVEEGEKENGIEEGMMRGPSELSEKVEDQAMETEFVVTQEVKVEGIDREEGIDNIIKLEEGGGIVQVEISKNAEQEAEKIEENREGGERKEENGTIEHKEQQIDDDDDDDWGDFNDSSSSFKESVPENAETVSAAVELEPGNPHEQIQKDESIDTTIEMSDGCDGNNQVDNKEILPVSNTDSASTSSVNEISHSISDKDTVSSNGIDSSPNMHEVEDKDDEWDDFEGAVESSIPVVDISVPRPLDRMLNSHSTSKTASVLDEIGNKSNAKEEGDALHLLLDEHWNRDIKNQYVTFREKTNSIFGQNFVNVKDIHDLKNLSSSSSSSERLSYTQLKSPLAMATLCASSWAKQEVFEVNM